LDLTELVIRKGDDPDVQKGFRQVDVVWVPGDKDNIVKDEELIAVSLSAVLLVR
jgi:hypothetical protein